TPPSMACTPVLRCRKGPSHELPRSPAPPDALPRQRGRRRAAPAAQRSFGHVPGLRRVVRQARALGELAGRQTSRNPRRAALVGPCPGAGGSAAARAAAARLVADVLGRVRRRGWGRGALAPAAERRGA